MDRNFEHGDEGKRVVTADGDEVGMVSRVEDDRLHIRPADNLSRGIRRRLGWSEDQNEDEYTLQKSKVETIQGDEVHLKEDL